MSKAEILTTPKGENYLRRLFMDGEPVSSLVVVPCPIRLLGVEVSHAGIGGVNTEPEHRLKGYMARLMADTVNYMTRQGYAVSLLWGIPDFYNKFGFMPVMGDPKTSVATRDAQRAQPGPFTIREMREQDAGFVVELYNRRNRNRAASVVRDSANFSHFVRGSRWDSTARGVICEDEQSRPVGYAAQEEHDEAVKVTELHCTTPRAYPALLRYFADVAVERPCEEIEFCLPCDHAFVHALRRYGCTVQTQYFRMSEGMMRILNQGPLLARLKGALEARLGHSEFADRPVQFDVETDLGHSGLTLNAQAGGETLNLRIQLPQGKLAQLIVGHALGPHLLAHPECEMDEDALPLLDVLFGGQEAYTYMQDRF